MLRRLGTYDNAIKGRIGRVTRHVPKERVIPPGSLHSCALQVLCICCIVAYTRRREGRNEGNVTWPRGFSNRKDEEHRYFRSLEVSPKENARAMQPNAGLQTVKDKSDLLGHRCSPFHLFKSGDKKGSTGPALSKLKGHKPVF